MKKLLTIAALLLLASPALATDGVRVIDGDTIQLNGMPIRLLGIDTPETLRPHCANERALGLKAKERMIELLDGAEVTYEASNELEPWGRVLATVYANGVDVGQKLYDEGLALYWARGPKAKAARIAIWCGPTK